MNTTGRNRKAVNGGFGGLSSGGYLIVCNGDSKTKVHVAVAERALGKALPDGAVVHHVNLNKVDNRSANLVICPDDAYHALLHTRLDALENSGNPDWRRCRYCGKYDSLENMALHGAGAKRARRPTHMDCHYNVNLRAKLRRRSARAT